MPVKERKGYTRLLYYVKDTHHAKMIATAHRRGEDLIDVVNQAFAEYLSHLDRSKRQAAKRKQLRAPKGPAATA